MAYAGVRIPAMGKRLLSSARRGGAYAGVRCACACQCSALSGQAAKKAFDQYDTDGSGNIEEEEPLAPRVGGADASDRALAWPSFRLAVPPICKAALVTLESLTPSSRLLLKWRQIEGVTARSAWMMSCGCLIELGQIITNKPLQSCATGYHELH